MHPARRPALALALDRLLTAAEAAALAGAALVVALKAVEAAPRLVLSLMELFPWT